MPADDLHDMLLYCYEEQSKSKIFSTCRVRLRIQEHIREKNRQLKLLYNPYRNISLNQCVGDSDTPVSEWMNVSGWQEWDDD